MNYVVLSIAIVCIIFGAVAGREAHRHSEVIAKQHNQAPAITALQEDLAKRRAYAAEHPEKFPHEPVQVEAPVPVAAPVAAPAPTSGMALPANMTLRQYYAGQALQGLLAHEGACFTDMTKAAQARRAIDAADSLLAESP